MENTVWKPPGEPGLWGDFLDYLREVAERGRVHPTTYEYLVHPERVTAVALPVKMDDRRVRTFRGWRVVHNTARGPSIGGVRYDPALNLGDVAGLAAWTTLKSAMLGLPFGGAAGGIPVDRGRLSQGELERLSRRYMFGLVNLAGPEVDVLAPELGTDAQVMSWYLDTYSQAKGFAEPAVVVGKPPELAGDQDRNRALAEGLVHVLARLAGDPSGQRVAVQGFGQVGRALALALYEAGARVVAVSMDSGGVYDEKGLDVPALIAHFTRHEGFLGFPAGALTNDELLRLPVDALVLAAYQHVITEANAREVRAPWVVEAAHVPVTREADRLLSDAGIRVIPHVLATGGGLVSDYLEWVQTLNQHFWKKDRVNRQIRAVLDRALAAVEAEAEKNGNHLRSAAHVVAIRRIDEATRLRGVYP